MMAAPLLVPIKLTLFASAAGWSSATLAINSRMKLTSSAWDTKIILIMNCRQDLALLVVDVPAPLIAAGSHNNSSIRQVAQSSKVALTSIAWM